MQNYWDDVDLASRNPKNPGNLISNKKICSVIICLRVNNILSGAEGVEGWTNETEIFICECICCCCCKKDYKTLFNEMKNILVTHESLRTKMAPRAVFLDVPQTFLLAADDFKFSQNLHFLIRFFSALKKVWNCLRMHLRVVSLSAISPIKNSNK